LRHAGAGQQNEQTHQKGLEDPNVAKPDDRFREFTGFERRIGIDRQVIGGDYAIGQNEERAADHFDQELVFLRQPLADEIDANVGLTGVGVPDHERKQDGVHPVFGFLKLGGVDAEAARDTEVPRHDVVHDSDDDDDAEPGGNTGDHLQKSIDGGADLEEPVRLPLFTSARFGIVH